MIKVDRNGYSSRIDYKIFDQILTVTEIPKYTLLWTLLYVRFVSPKFNQERTGSIVEVTVKGRVRT